MGNAQHMSDEIPTSVDEDLACARRIVESVLAGQKARAWLFGSRARSAARSTSDIDIGILPEDPLRKGTLSLLREALEESRIPYTVDVVDLSEVSEGFRRKVAREGVLWRA